MSNYDSFSEHNAVPDGRAYLHDACGQETFVSEGHFTQVCDPYRFCNGTFCCHCNDVFPLSTVRWEDTGELISDFRARMKDLTPTPLKVWRGGLGFVVGLAIGGYVGRGFQGAEAGGWLVPGAAVFGGLAVAIVGAMILGAIYRIDYRLKR